MQLRELPSALDPYLDELTGVFREAGDKHDAHVRASSILDRFGRDPDVLRGALAKHLQQGDALSRRHYPVLALEIESNPYFELVANCWIASPEGSPDRTAKAIHHHGDLLLSTITAFGPGYEHWTFGRPQKANDEQSRYYIPSKGSGIHGLHELAFVDADEAHVPFFPQALTVTYCLWSSKQPKTWRDTLKRIGPIQKRSAQLRKLATRLGLAEALDVKNVEYFDFHPTPEGFVGMAERDEFERGPVTDYLQSLIHVLIETGNGDLTELIQVSNAPAGDQGFLRELIARAEAGERIEGRLSPGHYGVSTANFSRAEIERALRAQESSAAAAA